MLVMMNNRFETLIRDLGRERDDSGEERTRVALSNALRAGQLSFRGVGRALDFGAGYGGPTNALKDLLRKGTYLAAAELNPGKSVDLIDFGIVPAERVYGDGISHLRSLRGLHTDKYDLVTAFMFGADHTGTLLHVFLESCKMGLSPKGQIILTSDVQTFLTMMGFCREKNIEFKVIPGNQNSPPIPTLMHIQRLAVDNLQTSKVHIF